MKTDIECIFVGVRADTGPAYLAAGPGCCLFTRLCGAALPHRTMNILRSMPNVIVSPHNAFYTDVNVASMVRSGFEELTDFAAGRSNLCEVPL